MSNTCDKDSICFIPTKGIAKSRPELGIFLTNHCPGTLFPHRAVLEFQGIDWTAKEGVLTYISHPKIEVEIWARKTGY